MQMMNLEALLPQLLPRAVAWAESQAQQIAVIGMALEPDLLHVASLVGVQRPELIRLMLVDSLPFPEDPTLKTASIQTGMLSPNFVGLTLGYGIYIVRGHESIRLISHECRHVHQYESFGSIKGFLSAYLPQIIQFGYSDAPLEIDARAHEMN